MPFNFKKLDVPGLVLIEPKVFYDERGFLLETFKETEFVNAGINEKFVQDNHSYSKKNVIRGLHYQLPPKSQGKLLRVVRGKIFDVAVDIRKSSPTYLKWVGVELSEKNMKMLYIPEGFAHGFIALEDSVHLLYKCTNEYSKESEAGIRYNDPDICIDWKLQSHPIICEKDKNLPFVKDAMLFD